MLVLLLATPAFAAAPDAAVLIPRLFEARAGCVLQAQASEVAAAECTLKAEQAIWDAQDLDGPMTQALAEYRHDVLQTAHAADAKTLSETVLARRRLRADQALRSAMFGRAVKFTEPALDPAGLPSREDLVQVFPAKAAAQKVVGRAAMSCRVVSDGRLEQCRVVSEAPPDFGFGQAALALSKLLKGKPAMLDGRPVGGAIITFALDFNPAWL